jgi:hypothetical protein
MSATSASLRNAAKRFIFRHAPRSAFIVSSLRFRRAHGARSARERGEARRLLFGGGAPAVLSGPFAGMRYLDEFTFGPIAARWLGVYEPQLHPEIERIATEPYDSFVDIGAAEGYYAVGIGRRRPDLAITTFEADPWSRGAQHRLAALNGVRNIAVRGLCDARSLERALGARPVVLCDIEGAELGLLDPAACPALRRADLIVELHVADGRPVPEVGDILAARFRATHTALTLADDEPRRARLLAALAATGRDPAPLRRFADEARSQPNAWLVLTRAVAASGDGGTA